MWVYIALVAMWIGIIIGWLVPVIRQRISCEVYEAFGLGLCFTIPFLGFSGIGTQLDILPLRIIGFILCGPAAFFTISAFIALKNKGKPTDHWESTTVLINSSIFQIVRHPMYLGTAIFAIAFALLSQSLTSLILGMVSVFCCWTAARKEDAFNTDKFGDSYKEYMAIVPMWNALLRKRTQE
ncbi:methyltransferase family protein [Chloroflexota bacterium]